MFKYERLKVDEYRKITGTWIDETKSIALNTNNEEEMFELIKTGNPFILRELAKNRHLTKKVAMHILEYNTAYTMCINLANNAIVDKKIMEKLYEIATNGIYKDSMMKHDLDSIFKKGR